MKLRLKQTPDMLHSLAPDEKIISVAAMATVYLEREKYIQYSS